MRRPIWILLAGALATLSVLTACSKAPEAPVAASRPEPLPAREIGLRDDQVRFDRTGVAAAVRIEHRPASRLPARPAPGTLATPAHLLVILDPATLADPAVPESRSLIVYPAIDWSRTYRRLGRSAEDPLPLLKKVLDDEPQRLDIGLPMVAGYAGAHEVFRTRTQYLRFHHGRGVRFLAAYQADMLPVTDQDVIYVFHGLTDDGKYWVTLNYPLTSRALPAPDAALASLADYDRFVAGHKVYLDEVVKKLGAARAEDFTPRLERLDGMLESLAIE